MNRMFIFNLIAFLGLTLLGLQALAQESGGMSSDELRPHYSQTCLTLRFYSDNGGSGKNQAMNKGTASFLEQKLLCQQNGVYKKYSRGALPSAGLPNCNSGVSVLMDYCDKDDTYRDGPVEYPNLTEKDKKALGAMLEEFANNYRKGESLFVREEAAEQLRDFGVSNGFDGLNLGEKAPVKKKKKIKKDEEFSPGEMMM